MLAISLQFSCCWLVIFYFKHNFSFLNNFYHIFFELGSSKWISTCNFLFHFTYYTCVNTKMSYALLSLQVKKRLVKKKKKMLKEYRKLGRIGSKMGSIGPWISLKRLYFRDL
uniref:Uncharacterized protein n=1 Tax=Cacopsylla melanoneura TaxID=428564 RepID=A0A8D8S111_9HEMI